jgi:hypothetical protein
MYKSSSDDIPLYGPEAIISTIDNEKDLLDEVRKECKNQDKKINYLNEKTCRRQGNTNKRKNKNIIKLSLISNISMD